MVSLNAVAGEKEKTAPSKPKQAQKGKTTKTAATKSQEPKRVAITGSYVKQPIRRNGQVTDGASPVLVIDSRAVQESGASDLRQLLTRQGVSH